ncbi:MAG: PAC2 family protein [Candidatus Bathyarchaeota archaeon]|nr:MAG: PAC2 family protein [Candidatus Bathyarchaeota archaeon]
MDTIIKEIRNVKLKNPILICGFPGLGYIGKISVDYLVEKLKAKKLSTLYTPYFPHHVFVDSSSRIRLPKAQFFFLGPSKSKNWRFDSSNRG